MAAAGGFAAGPQAVRGKAKESAHSAARVRDLERKILIMVICRISQFIVPDEAGMENAGGGCVLSGWRYPKGYAGAEIKATAKRV